MNYFKTTVLLIALTLLLVWVGSMFGGRQGAVFAFAIAMGMNFFSYWFSDKIVLKMYGARRYLIRSHRHIMGLSRNW